MFSWPFQSFCSRRLALSFSGSIKELSPFNSSWKLLEKTQETLTLREYPPYHKLDLQLQQGPRKAKTEILCSYMVSPRSVKKRERCPSVYTSHNRGIESQFDLQFQPVQWKQRLKRCVATIHGQSKECQ